MLGDLKWRLRTAARILVKGRSVPETPEVKWYAIPYSKDFEEDVEALRRLGNHPSWTEVIYLAVSGLKYIVSEMLDGQPVYIRRGDMFLPVRVKSYDGLVKPSTNQDQEEPKAPTETFSCH